MITNLSQDFLDAMNDTSRKPIQLLEFSTSKETFYLSDSNVGTLEGLERDYQPWIESWGTLKDNANITNLYDGNSLEIRTGTITIIVSPDSKTFVKTIFQEGIENTEIKLFQWFNGISSDPVLIDVLACQDPIRSVEASMLLSIDLVSVLMRTDAPLWPTVKNVSDQPIIVGKAKGVPLKDLQTSRVTDLADDITYDYTGPVFIGNGVGFPASGLASIDSEIISYDSITASSINITARGVDSPEGASSNKTPHLRGSLLVPYGAIYDYVICSGPVESVDNLVANGEPYINDVEFFPGQHPVIARFTGRPPWLKVEQGAEGPDIIPDPVTTSEYATGETSSYGDGASAPDNIEAVNSPTGAATMRITNTVGGGAGSTQQYATKTIKNNAALVYNQQFFVVPFSAAGLGKIEGRASTTLGTLSDRVVSSWDMQFNKDLSGFGNLLNVTVDIDMGTSVQVLHGADVKVRLVLVLGGQKTTLKEWSGDDANAYEVTNVFNKGPWSGYSNTFNLGITDWSILETAIIRIEAENIRSKTYSEFSNTYRVQVSSQSVKWNISYFTPAGDVQEPYQRVYSNFDRLLSGLGGTIENVTVNVKSATSISNANVNLTIFQNSTPLTSFSLSASQSSTVRQFILGSMSWEELRDLSISVQHQITGPTGEGETRISNTSFEYVEYVITYQPGNIATPDEVRVVYAETVECDVTSKMGEDPTPAKVIEYLIDSHSGSGSYIDRADFEQAHTNYLASGYFLNGVMEAKTTLHEALKLTLREGLCRFLFNQGKIKLISYFEEIDQEIDFDVKEDIRLLRSAETNNQPTSTIKNDITVLYDKDYSESTFAGEVNVANDISVAKFLRQKEDRELQLVDSETVAQLHADRLLSLLSEPQSITKFKVFLPGYIIEKGDRVRIESFLDDRFHNVGNALTVNRIFGQGKTKKINTLEIAISNPESFADLELKTEVVINDDSALLLKGWILPKEEMVLDDSIVETKREFKIFDAILVKEDFHLDLCVPNGYGTCGFGSFGYGR